jgi:hypothetical protein
MTRDLMDALARIEAAAKQAQQDLEAGYATTGRSALKRIEYAAADARRHHDEDLLEAVA